MKDKIISIAFTIVLVFFLVFGIILPDKEISISERRKLQGFPKLEIEEVFSGKFFTKLDDYLVEQFPLRDWFRKLKGTISTKVFQKKENNGVFQEENKIYQLNANVDEKSIEHILSLITKIKESNLKSDKLYFSIIPDKNYYLASETIPKLDYQKVEELFNEKLSDMTYINIFDDLDLSSYYDTDIHWKQEKLELVANKLATSMGQNSIKMPEIEKTYNSFYGALYGQIASNIKPDVLTYLTNEELENVKVYNFEKKEYEKVYEEENLKNIDSYDVYLSGATPLLIIENENTTSKKELVIFRDSFASSLTPLLVSNYEKITMIDLRYLSSTLLDKIEEIEFNSKQDILFLYSIPVINNSYTLK